MTWQRSAPRRSRLRCANSCWRVTASSSPARVASSTPSLHRRFADQALEEQMPAYLRIVLAAFGAALLGASSAHAQDYPAREIHSIVNFPPGSPMDILTRWYGARLSELAGKPVIVENKLGAQGAIATDYVARSKPDGYTFMITPASSTLAEVAFIFKRL